MISKETANKVLEEVIENKHRTKSQSVSSIGVSSWTFLDEKFLAACESDPEVIKQVINFSHSRWQVIVIAFLWMSSIFYLIYFSAKPLNIPLLMFVVLGGGLLINRLIRHYVLQYFLNPERIVK